MDWTRHENVRHMHPEADLLWPASEGEVTTRRLVQALQGRTEAEPKGLWNTAY